MIGEAVASGLVLDESALWNDTDWVSAAKFVMSPPIRRLAVDGAALQAALAQGALQLVGTDHCAFNSTQKAAGRHDFRMIPNGVNGIEERMIVVWDALVRTAAARATSVLLALSSSSSWFPQHPN